jgi:hypothetical protein
MPNSAKAGFMHGNARPVRSWEGRAVDAGGLASQGSEPFNSDEERSLSSSDPDSSSDDDACSSKD